MNSVNNQQAEMLNSTGQTNGVVSTKVYSLKINWKLISLVIKSFTKIFRNLTSGIFFTHRDNSSYVPVMN